MSRVDYMEVVGRVAQDAKAEQGCTEATAVFNPDYEFLATDVVRSSPASYLYLNKSN